MKKFSVILLLLVVMLQLSSCSQMKAPAGGSVAGGRNGGVVVLDIGHFIGGDGACTPGAVNGKRLTECTWWYQYVYYTKKVIEDAGYTCIVTNRGNAPTTEPLASYARRAGVVQLNHPDKNGARYPSTYHPDRVAGGMVSADYAISRKADCVVFLHHNSSGGWTNGPSPSLIICNKYNGGRLGNALARTLEHTVLNRGLDNGGRGCSVTVRSKDADRSAGWMNACDDSGIPAAVIECAFLNNRKHADYLANDTNARRYAEAIGKGVVNYMRYFGNEKRHYRADENAADEGSFGYAAESRRLNVPGAKRLLH
ncbi:MAG: N-acetylmuramoyl-L-alanine amidase [Akkermansia sp.]|nr:N-acetylmuramoyl-L-alanine amidase [Akkermansia sp.]